MTPTLNDILTPLSAMAACTQAEFTGIRSVVENMNGAMMDSAMIIHSLGTEGLKDVTKNQKDIVKAITKSSSLKPKADKSSSSGEGSAVDSIGKTLSGDISKYLKDMTSLLKAIAKDTHGKVRGKTVSPAAPTTPSAASKAPKMSGKSAPFADVADGIDNVKRVATTVKDIKLTDLLAMKIKLPMLKKMINAVSEMLRTADVSDLAKKKKDFETLTSVAEELPVFYDSVMKSSAYAVLATVLIGKNNRLAEVADYVIDALKVFSKKGAAKATDKENFERIRQSGRTVLSFMKDVAITSLLALPAMLGAAGFWLTSKLVIAGVNLFKEKDLGVKKTNTIKRTGKAVMTFMAETALAGILTPVALIGAAGFLLTGLLVSSGVKLVINVLQAGKGIKNPLRGIEKMGLAVLTFMASMVLVTVLAPVASIGATIALGLLTATTTVFSKLGNKKNTKNIRNAVINIALMSLGFVVFSGAFTLSALMVRSFIQSGEATDNITALVATVGLFGLMLGSMYVMKTIGKGMTQVAKGTLGVALMGIGLIVFGFGVKTAMSAVSGMDWGDMFKLPVLLATFGVEFAILGVPVVAGFVALGSGAAIAMGVGIVGFSLGLRLGLAAISGVDEDDRNWLMKSLGLFGAEFSLLGLASLPIALGAGALTLLSASVMTFGTSLGVFKAVGLEEEDVNVISMAIDRVPKAIKDSEIGLKVAAKAAIMPEVAIGLAAFAHGIRIAAENVRKIGDLGDFGELGKIDLENWTVTGGEGPLYSLQKVYVGLYNIFDTIGKKIVEDKIDGFLKNPARAILGSVMGGGNPIELAIRSFSNVGGVVKTTAAAFSEVLNIVGKDIGEAGEIGDKWTVSGGTGAIGAVQNIFAGLYGVFGRIGDKLYEQMQTGKEIYTGPRLFRMFQSPKSSLELAISSFSGVGTLLKNTTSAFMDAAALVKEGIGEAGTIGEDWTVAGGKGAIQAIQVIFSATFSMFDRMGEIIRGQLSESTKELDEERAKGGMAGFLAGFKSPKSNVELAIMSFGGVGEIVKGTVEGFKTATELAFDKLGVAGEFGDNWTVKEPEKPGAIYAVQKIFAALFSMFNKMGIELAKHPIETSGGFLGLMEDTTNPLAVAIGSMGGMGEIVRDSVDAFKKASEITEELMGEQPIITMVGHKLYALKGSGALLGVSQALIGPYNVLVTAGDYIKDNTDTIEETIEVMGNINKAAKKSTETINFVLEKPLDPVGMLNWLTVSSMFYSGTVSLNETLASVNSDVLKASFATFKQSKKMFDYIAEFNEKSPGGAFNELAEDFNKGVAKLTNKKGIEKVTEFVKTMTNAKRQGVWDNLRKNVVEINKSIEGLSSDLIAPLSEMVQAMRDLATHSKQSEKVLEEMKKAADALKEALSVSKGGGGENPPSFPPLSDKSDEQRKSNNREPAPKKQEVNVNVNAAAFERAVDDFSRAVRDFGSKTGS